jgi:hypothetical protein
MMRRDVGMVLARLGTFLIVLAIALPAVIAKAAAGGRKPDSSA